MMVKISISVLILMFIQSCATAPQKHVTELVLPKKWQARSLKDKWGAQCARPRPVGMELWTFCHGKHSAHGSLMRMNPQTQTIEETIITSRDPLAMSVSVTAESSWVVGTEKVWVGTEDGRILVFNFSGKQVGRHEFPLHAWVQHLRFNKNALYAVVSRFNDVSLVKLDDDLDVDTAVKLAATRQSVEFLLHEERLIVTTDLGSVLEFDKKLQLQRTHTLSPNSSLGDVLVNHAGIYVGNEAGVLFHIDPQNQIKSIKKSTSPISSAPVMSSQGLWVAYDEEGSLRLFDQALNLKKKLDIPFDRSLLGLRPMVYGQHLLLEVTSFGHVNLLNAEGEVLLSKEDPGTLNWEITPSDVTDILEATRTPAGQNR